MTRVYRNSAEILAERAMEPDRPVRSERAPDPQTKTQQRRLIYSGTMPVPSQVEFPTGTSLPPKNRHFTKHRVSPFNVILILMGAAVTIVLYISNIIAVDQLVNDIHKSDVRLQEILNEQEIMHARINQMSSLERVRKRAEEELGLRNPNDIPGWIEVDQEKISSIEEAVRSH